ncbi:MAG: heparinase II/III domain-containing protein [Candidatus Latescibacterota bacterium]
MKHALIAFLAVILLFGAAFASHADTVLEPFTYSENFEARLLGAWASYPLWQDIAYDPNFRINTMGPGDPNISIEEKVTPYTNVDNYCGAEKLLDMYLVPGSTIRLRFMLKSHLPFEYLKVRVAAGPDGKVDYTFVNPDTNKWVWITVSWDDFLRENPRLAGKDRVKVNALALLAKCPKADPTMPFYFGLDDVTFKGARATAFQFAEPAMHKLAEYKPYIPKKPYARGDSFVLKGAWPLNADRVDLTVTSYTDRSKKVYAASLKKTGEVWALTPLALDWPDGLYLGTLQAWGGDKKNPQVLSDTEFTIHVAPKNINGKHPRLWFDAAKKEPMLVKMKGAEFKNVYEGLAKQASSQRSRFPLTRLVYDIDQYPDEDWLPTWSESGSKILPTGEAVLSNGLAWNLTGDREAAEFGKNMLLKLAEYPTFNHPWQIKRGRYADHRSGAWAHRMAVGYDLLYDAMTEPERVKVRKALFDNFVKDAFKSHVADNNITANTSNWLAMITGGSMLMQTAMWGDGPDVENMEPYFTGTAMKLYNFLQRVTESSESWGEGFGYNRYSFDNLQRSLPALENVFNIDMSLPVRNSYKEYIWSGLIKEKKHFYYGDSGEMGTMSNWNWLLAKTKDPLLSWFYNYMKADDTIFDVLYDTKGIPQQDPFSLSPSKLFREGGTTVFKSGWESTDMSFTLRTGPFYNHQHIDQGSFWFADRGVVFIEERHGSTYYDDPLYQPWYTQPVGHSTILIDGNHQSQRVGDHLVFAEGFDDYAHVTHYLEGEFAAFTTGDIGRLYWDKVKGLERNVLFLKPRVLLMLDTAYPAERDADVTMLYQTLRLQDITAGGKRSTITKEGKTLSIMHLAPEKVDVAAVETPHYLYTLQRNPVLEKEGMLTVTARTVSGNPLVAANLLTTTEGNAAPDVTYAPGDGFVSGKASGVDFAFTTRPGSVYTAGGFTTDATAVTWKGGKVFAARCTQLAQEGKTLVKAATPVTCEVSGGTVKYYHCTAGAVSFGASAKPAGVTVNGAAVTDFTWNAEGGLVTVNLPQGEGTVNFK